MKVGYWQLAAELAIREAHEALPENATLAERKAAIDAAYPFGPRKYHPYKMWLKQRRAYLSKYGYISKSKALQESPLERLMRRGQR